METVQLIVWIIILFFLIALYRKLPTVDDPTGEKKQQIFDSLTKVIEDIKSTV